MLIAAMFTQPRRENKPCLHCLEKPVLPVYNLRGHVSLQKKTLPHATTAGAWRTSCSVKLTSHRGQRLCDSFYMRDLEPSDSEIGKRMAEARGRWGRVAGRAVEGELLLDGSPRFQFCIMSAPVPGSTWG